MSQRRRVASSSQNASQLAVIHVACLRRVGGRQTDGRSECTAAASAAVWKRNIDDERTASNHVDAAVLTRSISSRVFIDL